MRGENNQEDNQPSHVQDFLLQQQINESITAPIGKTMQSATQQWRRNGKSARMQWARQSVRSNGNTVLRIVEPLDFLWIEAYTAKSREGKKERSCLGAKVDSNLECQGCSEGPIATPESPLFHRWEKRHVAKKHSDTLDLRVPHLIGNYNNLSII